MAHTSVEETAMKPNVIYILCDDLGYGDLGCYGSQTIRTPNIDRLAAQGIRFTDFYAPASWCMPSRMGLMTGMHPYRLGLARGNDEKPKRSVLAEPSRVTMAEMFRQAGYRTALIGKWHLGMRDEGCHPLDRGFDEFYGTAGSNDWGLLQKKKSKYEAFSTVPKEGWATPLYRGYEEIEAAADQSQWTQRYTRETIEYIDRNRDQPFFLYLSHNMPHAPLFASQAFQGKSRGGVYGDVVEELDWSVGQIVEALEDRGLTENTLVVFTSDNGPWTCFKEHGGTAHPLRGEKSTCWEGGPRVPGIVCWPGRIAPRVSEEFVVAVDMYATFAELAGGEVRDGQAIDSLDCSAMLLDDEPSPRQEYLFYEETFAHSYRKGPWKIHFATREQTRDIHTGAAIPSVRLDEPLLYHLPKDISERRDLAGENPDVVAELTAGFNALAAEIDGTGAAAS